MHCPFPQGIQVSQEGMVSGFLGRGGAVEPDLALICCRLREHVTVRAPCVQWGLVVVHLRVGKVRDLTLITQQKSISC